MYAKMHFNNHKLIIFHFLFFIHLFHLILTDERITDIELNKTVTGSIFEANTYEYYKLRLPTNIKNGNILVFTVKESRKGIREGEDLFSDPDIHVSKINKYPKGKDKAEWYSQRYGNDILSIPAEEVKPGDIFYIGMFCEVQCRYELNSYLTEELQIDIGKINTVTLKDKTSIIWRSSFSRPSPSASEESERSACTASRRSSGKKLSFAS